MDAAIATLVSGVVFGVAMWTRNRIYQAVLVAVLLLIIVLSGIQHVPTIG